MPQIEMMMADLPHTLYKSKKAEAKRMEDDAEEAVRLTREAAERRKKAEKSGEYTIDDVFDGIADNE